MFVVENYRINKRLSLNLDLKNLILIIPLIFIFSSCLPQGKSYKNYRTPIHELLDEMHIKDTEVIFLIDKSEFKLSILYDSIIIKEFPIVLGGNPKDDKLMQGDKCTPEGDFHIISKYPHKNWSKFIWIDYPNDQSWKKHNEAKQNGLIPKNASIGGEIGIHGVPENMNSLIDLKYNWTLGCISLKNEDINEIYPLFSNTNLIRIQK